MIYLERIIHIYIYIYILQYTTVWYNMVVQYDMVK